MESTTPHTTENIEKARHYAEAKFSGIARLSGDNLYDHSLAVYQNLINSGVTEEDVLVVSLLHPLPAHHPQALNEVREIFGEEIYQLLKTYEGLDKVLIRREGSKNYNENYILQTFMNLCGDLRVLMVRLADKAHNIETVFPLSEEERTRIAKRAIQIYAPAAKLVGANYLRNKLENESLKILQPGIYFRIKESLNERWEKSKLILDETTPIIKSLLEEQGVNCEISYRLKSIYSVYKKTQKYQSEGIEVGETYERIKDIAAARIIVPSIPETYAVEDLLKTLWEEIPHLRKDNIKNPRPSGYRSLHNIFKIEKDLEVEVQIKTHEMHQEAEYGLSSHFFYKNGERFKHELKNNPDWVRSLNYWEHDKTTSAGDDKINHFTKHVYPFTPKGDIIELDRGSTVIDFAYAVHTSIGNRCKGGKINGHLVKIDTQVNDGDIVEIITTKEMKKPSSDWLNVCKMKKTRWAILKALRDS